VEFAFEANGVHRFERRARVRKHSGLDQTKAVWG
jgi:hypothetical protein